MKSIYRALGAGVLLLAGVCGQAFAAIPAAPPEMQKLNYLIGTWNCSWSAGSQSGTNTQTWTTALNGTWLLATEAVPTAKGPVVISLHYTSYDPKTKKWSHVGPNLGGGYDVAESPDAVEWQTVLPDTSEKLTMTHVSDTQYKQHASAQMGGQAVTFLQTCTKAPG